MLPQLEIHVDGKGSCFRTAERGYLRLRIASTSTDQAQALSDAQTAVAKINLVIRALAPKTDDGLPRPDAAVAGFSATPLSTASQHQRDPQHRPLLALPREHTVGASAEIIFRDMARLAAVSAELAAMPHVSVAETEWRLTDATRALLERDARLQAVRAAVRKAGDYAGVVGRRVAAVEIRDQPMVMQQLQQQQQRSGSAAGGMSMASGGGAEALALEPKTITVSAHVSAKFVSVDGDGGRVEAVQCD
ncbi:hypothetical protein BT67DRAFT_376664 [Trichocladium antarcticum]|uniref:Uncharacterized protein n=1 Tax=Trichocladium antarcticum TaxID=1450529 RepID=A0AAN6UML1_9PEZI|nr:hypothetical protein BT67DRAFT_376664 [Trichocladium antarcticum]